jgi:hypothetical protein
MNTIAAEFKSLVKRILQEEIQKRVPEMSGNGIDPSKKTKTFSSDANSRDRKSKDEMCDEISKAVKGIDPSATVVWDDHDDLMINGRDILFARITPLWEDNFKIVFYNRNEDRFFFTGLTWKQVVEFVKDNIDKKNHHTEVEKARDKAWRNAEEKVQSPDKGLSQKDKPKKKEVGDTKNKAKDYNEKQVPKDADLPDKPMKEVGDEFERQNEHKVKDPVKLRKRLPDKKHIVKNS